MSDTIYVVHARPNDGNNSSNWTFSGAFSSRSIPMLISKPIGFSTTITPLTLDQDRTVYFRELKHCQACYDVDINAGDFKAYVVEAKHDDVMTQPILQEVGGKITRVPDNDQIPCWHFDAVLPNLEEAQTYVADNEKFTRRIYEVKLPYSRDTFSSRINIANKQDTEKQSTNSQEKKDLFKKTSLIQKDMAHTKLVVNRIFLLGVVILILNVFVLFFQKLIIKIVIYHLWYIIFEMDSFYQSIRFLLVSDPSLLSVITAF
jgi:hypothetical protein